MDRLTFLIVVGWGVVEIMCLFGMFARLYRKVGPHEALLVYGFRGTRVVKGGGRDIVPTIEIRTVLSLPLMSLDVPPQHHLYTNPALPRTAEPLPHLNVKPHT